MQFIHNPAIHGSGLDTNATLPNPVISVDSHFTYNGARVVDEDALFESVHCVLYCRCEGCLAVILEQAQFINNSAIHGGGVDINTTLPNPVIIVDSQFTYNGARVVEDNEDAANSNLTTSLAGNGGGIRCLGGEMSMIVLI